MKALTVEQLESFFRFVARDRDVRVPVALYDGTRSLGRLDDGEEPLRIGEPEPEGGVLSSLSRVDLAYVDRWIDGEVLPVSLVLEDQTPANPVGTPITLPREELTEGSHLGYAIQWFAFAAIVVGGVAFLVWRAGTKDDDAAAAIDHTATPTT